MLHDRTLHLDLPSLLYSPGNEDQIGEIINVQAKFGTVVGEDSLNNILKVLACGGWAKAGGGGGGALKIIFLGFFVNN